MKLIKIELQQILDIKKKIWFPTFKKNIEENYFNKSVFLELKYSNFSALRLYNKAEFKGYNNKRNYYSYNYDVLIMCLKQKS